MDGQVKNRCVAVSPRHDFIRPWIRAYFSSGNNIPLVIVPGPPGDWKDGDAEYCRAAAEYTGGRIFDCSAEWESAKSQKSRANAKGFNVGWYTKKNILVAVASRLSPGSWAWIDDDAEVTGSLDECFDFADGVPGFVCAQFYYPGRDRRHPAKTLRGKSPLDQKICWNSMVFFHGRANKHLMALDRKFPIEDDEVAFWSLYRSNEKWHDGFFDFSYKGWQKMCQRIELIPRTWRGKLLHYTGVENNGEIKRYWADRVNALPKAPFE